MRFEGSLLRAALLLVPAGNGGRWAHQGCDISMCALGLLAGSFVRAWVTKSVSAGEKPSGKRMSVP